MDGQKHENSIFLFCDSEKYLVLKTISGLVCDGNYNTAKMNLYRFNGIYFPDDGFYNCNPFPIEWIEVFVDGRPLEPEDVGTQAQVIQPYSPNCTPAELRGMLETVQRNKAYDHIKGKTDTNISVSRRPESAVDGERMNRASSGHTMKRPPGSALTRIQTGKSFFTQQNPRPPLGGGKKNKLQRPQTTLPPKQRGLLAALIHSNSKKKQRPATSLKKQEGLGSSQDEDELFQEMNEERHLLQENLKKEGDLTEEDVRKFRTLNEKRGQSSRNNNKTNSASTGILKKTSARKGKPGNEDPENQFSGDEDEEELEDHLKPGGAKKTRVDTKTKTKEQDVIEIYLNTSHDQHKKAL
jgi:hypothetical protein